MRNPTPAPIVIPATGAPTCRGVALTVRPLSAWFRASDCAADPDDDVRMQADRATRDGHVLCLRPTVDRPACVGLSPTQFAVASLQDDFAARAMVVDPYTEDGFDIREVMPPQTLEADLHQAHLVAVWEGSEAP